MDTKNNEFEQVSNKFNELIEFGERIGNDLIKNNKTTKRKTISTSLNTPYEHSDDGRAKKQHEDSVLKESMKDFVQQIFRHYDVNPSIEGYNKRITETYVSQNLEVIPHLKREFPHIVNEDDLLYNDIYKLVQKIRENGDIRQEERKYYITGLRGAGKTSYINYFISKYEEELNKKNIISIRINILRITPEISLEDAIKFKLCRILFTYYCTWKQRENERLGNRNIKNNIDEYLDTIKNSSDNYSVNDIYECSDYFKKYNAKEPEKIPPQHEKICDLLLDFVVKDYIFIVILDNFDQVTKKDEEIHDKRKSELLNINKSFLFVHSVYIIALRYNTFCSLPTKTRSIPNCRVVGTPTTFDMLNKRISFFTATSESEIKNRQINCFMNLIKLIGANFMPDTSDAKKPISFEMACKLIDDIFYGNKRTMISMINRFINIIPSSIFDQLCEDNYENNCEHILDRLISQTYYKFFESLLINTNTGYCNSFFEYKREDGKYKNSHVNPTSFFDDNFIPNIYHFPAISHTEDVQFIPFLKIRILQLVKGYEKQSVKLTQNEIAKKLHNIFGYRADVTHLACEELRWDQSIVITTKAPDEEDESLRSYKLDITPRGEKLLEILPINVNLLAISLEKVFFPVSFLNTKIPIGNYNDNDISKFIIRNIFFSLPKTIGLFIAVEQHEKEVLLKRNPETNQKIFDIESDFAITKKLKEISNKTIARIYHSYFRNNHEQDTRFSERRNDLKQQLEINT